MTVRANIVEVEKVGQGHFADAEIEAADGNARGQGEGIRVLAAGFIGQPKDLVNLVAREVGDAAEVWIADHVQIGESGQSQRLAQPAASRGLHVQDEVGVVPDRMGRAHGRVERSDQGRLVLRGTAEAVRPLVRRVKRKTALEDDVGLAGKPVPAAFPVREHGELRIVGGRGFLAGFGSLIGAIELGIESLPNSG